MRTIERNYLYVQGSIKEFQDDGDDMDRYYLPVRATAFGVNRDNAMVAIPETDMTTTYVYQLGVILRQLGQKAPNTIMIPDEHYLLDVAIRDNLPVLEDNLQRGGDYVVRPYANSQNLRLWVNDLRESGYKLEIPMSERVYFEDLTHPQHRGGWSININNPDRGSIAVRHGLPYPKSYWGIGLDEVIWAREMVTGGNQDKTVYAKLMFSAGGFGVRRIQREDDLVGFYEEVKMSGSLYLFGEEQPFEIQQEIENVVFLASMQFSQGRVITPGGLALQQMNGGAESYNWAGNVFNSGYGQRLSGEAYLLGQKTANAYKKETGDDIEGGMDLAIIEKNDALSLMFIEPNIARTVGADPAIALGQAFGVLDKPFLIRKTGDPSADLETMWGMLKKEGLAFDPEEKKGVFPLLWIEGSGFLFAVGESEDDIRSMTDYALELAHKKGYAK